MRSLIGMLLLGVLGYALAAEAPKTSRSQSAPVSIMMTEMPAM